MLLLLRNHRQSWLCTEKVDQNGWSVPVTLPSWILGEKVEIIHSKWCDFFLFACLFLLLLLLFFLVCFLFYSCFFQCWEWQGLKDLTMKIDRNEAGCRGSLSKDKGKKTIDEFRRVLVDRSEKSNWGCVMEKLEHMWSSLPRKTAIVDFL